MATNRWQLGVMYNNGLLNGVPFYVQPDGPGTQVFPTQFNGPWLAYPIPGQIMNESIPWWTPGCLHAIKFWKVIREWDYDTNQSVALITCEICTYVQNAYSPFEEWLDPVAHAIIVA